MGRQTLTPNEKDIDNISLIVCGKKGPDNFCPTQIRSSIYVLSGMHLIEDIHITKLNFYMEVPKITHTAAAQFRAAAERLAEKAHDNVPEAGHFQKYTIAGHLTGDNMRGILGIEEVYQSDSARCVSLGVYCDGDDRMVSNFLFTGIKQAVLEWPESPEGQQEIVDAYIRLEEKLVHLLG